MTAKSDVLMHSLTNPETEVISLDGDPKDWPLEDRPVCYIAAYYTANPTHGAHAAIQMFNDLNELGWVPIVPHTNLLIDLVSPQTPDYWYSFDKAILKRCDALFVCGDPLSSESVGVRDEIIFATKHEIPVFYEAIPAKDRYER